MEKRVIMVCARCGSVNVRRDAWAEWYAAAQRWELGATFDHAHCDDCDGATKIEAQEIKEIEPGAEAATVARYAEHGFTITGEPGCWEWQEAGASGFSDPVETLGEAIAQIEAQFGAVLPTAEEA